MTLPQTSLLSLLPAAATIVAASPPHSGFKAKHHVSISDAGQIANNAIGQKDVFLYHKYILNIPFDTMDLYQSYNLKTTKNGHFSPNHFFSNWCLGNQKDF